jgi:heat shock protein HslJ
MRLRRLAPLLALVIAAACKAPAPPQEEAALSLDAIAGRTWVLTAWDVGEPSPAEPVVDLQLVDGHLAGSDGCNHYSAPVTQQDEAGRIALGPVIATRMACAEQPMAVEARFLDLLGRVTGFGLVGEELALDYEKDGAAGSLMFAPAPPDEG